MIEPGGEPFGEPFLASKPRQTGRLRGGFLGPTLKQVEISSQPQPPSSRPAMDSDLSTGDPRAFRGFACFVAVLVVVSIFMQSSVYIGHDVGWILYSADSMLDGAVFSEDIVDANPPLIWYLNIPPAALARLLDVSPVAVFRAYVYGLALFSLLLCRGALRATRDRGSAVETNYVMAALAFVFVVFPGQDFGQREHLAFVLGVPYVLLMTSRMRQRPSARWFAATVGITAALGFALKPYFLLVPLGLELCLLFRTRRITDVFRPETVAFLLTILAYVASVPLMAPEYLTSIVPMMRVIFGTFELPLGYVLSGLVIASLPLAIVLLVVSRSARMKPYAHAALAILTLGFACSYFIQAKGYTYHAYPALASVFVWSVFSLATSLQGQTSTTGRASFRLRQIATIAPAVVITTTILYCVPLLKWYWMANTFFGSQAQYVQRMVTEVDRLAGNGSFYAFSTHPFPGFPVANYSTADWAGRANNHIFLPGIIESHRSGSPEKAAQVRTVEQYARDSAVEDIARSQPKLILVDAHSQHHGLGSIDGSLLDVYATDPRFTELWNDYAEQDAVMGFRVFVRKPGSSGN